VPVYTPMEPPASSFREIMLSPTMLWDHLPNRYEFEIERVAAEWEKSDE